jgi:peptidoglycan/LPS O-acetylase OafA/YrhL
VTAPAPMALDSRGQTPVGKEHLRAHGPVDRIPALTTLRFFAASWVVLYHLGGPLVAVAPTAVDALVARGWLGVPFFFILSGFILAHVYGVEVRGRGLDHRAFWWARFARIYPMYLLALAVAFPLMLLGPRVGGIDTPLAGIIEVVLTPLMLQAWLPWMSIVWDAPAWTISVEAFFYATFPLVGVAVVRWKPSPWIVAAVSLAAALLLQATVLLPVPDPEPWRNFSAALPLWWLPFFVYGCALGEVRHRMAARGARVPAPVAWVALAGTLAILAFDPARHWAASPAVLVAEGLFGLILLAFSWPVVGTAWMGSRLALELGESSYALYLLHLPVETWIGLALGRGLAGPAARSISELVLVFVSLVVLSVAAHRLIERPARRALRRWRGLDAPRPTEPR